MLSRLFRASSLLAQGLVHLIANAFSDRRALIQPFVIATGVNAAAIRKTGSELTIEMVRPGGIDQRRRLFPVAQPRRRTASAKNGRSCCSND